ncbi:MAG: hypothetical protein ABGW78_03660 [Pirellulales bacterium]
MADIVFAFDPAIDQPPAVPEAAPPAIAQALSNAPLQSLQKAVRIAREQNASAFVLCGRVLDPYRASPAQATAVRTMIFELSHDGCQTIWILPNAETCEALSQALGEPQGLQFATPSMPVQLNVRGLPVEILPSYKGTTATLHQTSENSSGLLARRIFVGWDDAFWSSRRWEQKEAHDAQDSLGDLLQPGCYCLWGSRRSDSLPDGVRHIPPLQPHSVDEVSSGACALLSLTESSKNSVQEGRSVRWQTKQTHCVRWTTLTVESAAGGDEELATTLWSAIESLPSSTNDVMQIIRCRVECGTSVARRVRVAEIASETLARLRELVHEKDMLIWCEEICADPHETFAPLGHTRSGGQPGSTTSFSSALADIVSGIEHDQVQRNERPSDMAREAGWLALELLESA